MWLAGFFSLLFIRFFGFIDSLDDEVLEKGSDFKELVEGVNNLMKEWLFD